MKRAILSLGATAALAGCQSSVPLTETAVPPVTAATQQWAAAVSSCDVPRIVRLYDSDATIWDTATRSMVAGPAGIREHYDRICSAVGPGPRITLGEQRARVLGAAAVNSGTYTIASARAGDPPFPVRFSFTYRLGVDGWRIVDQHSSAFPAPLAPR